MFRKNGFDEYFSAHVILFCTGSLGICHGIEILPEVRKQSSPTVIRMCAKFFGQLLENGKREAKTKVQKVFLTPYPTTVTLNKYVRFNFSTAVMILIMFFWVKSPCGLVGLTN
jgi:hypothetical protein